MIQANKLSYHQGKSSRTGRTQTWEVGEIVKVGFLKLKVLAKIQTPGDYMPDAYALGSATGSIYRFVPHYGLQKCANLEEATQS